MGNHMIALGVRPPDIQDPAIAQRNALAIRAAQANQEQNALALRMQKLQLSEAERQAQANEQIRGLYAGGQQPTPEQVGAFDPAAAQTLRKVNAEIEKSTQQRRAAQAKAEAEEFNLKAEKAQQGADLLLAAVDDPAAYPAAIQGMQALGLDVSQLPQQYDPQTVLKLAVTGLGTKRYLEIQGEKAKQKLDQDKAAEDKRHHEAMELIQKGNVTEAELAARAAGGDPVATKALELIAQTAKDKRPIVKVAGSGSGDSSQSDPKAIADAIIAGQQPPELTGLYKMSGPIRAELGRRGFNLAAAQSDWKAMQKHLSTLNGAQQERLRQAVNFTYDSLDLIEENFEALNKRAGSTQFPVLNKANLARLRHGITTDKEAQSLATNLEAQINDLTSELGTVYKGGNASTDETLRLAAENLKGEWNPTTFRSALKQIRQNLAIRRNSINTSQPAGVSENSPYNTMPKETSTGGTKVGDVVNVGGKRIKISAIHQDGTFDGSEVK